MSGRNIALAIFLASASVASALYLLGVQFADGGVYPEYSSLRSDPEGAKLLFDTLALVLGTNVVRNFLPLAYVNGSGSAVILLKFSPELFAQDFLSIVDRLASRGNRVVVAAGGLRRPRRRTPTRSRKHGRFVSDSIPERPATSGSISPNPPAGRPSARQDPRVMAIRRSVGKEQRDRICR